MTALPYLVADIASGETGREVFAKSPQIAAKLGCLELDRHAVAEAQPNGRAVRVRQGESEWVFVVRKEIVAGKIVYVAREKVLT